MVNHLPDALTSQLDWLPLPAFVRCHEGVLRYVNQALLGLTGLRREKVVGKTNADFTLSPSAVERLQQEDVRVLGGEMVSSETLFFAPEVGREITLWVTKRRARHPEWGDVVVGIGHDVTDLKLRAEAGAPSEDQSKVFAHVSHELRTPLNGIVGLVDLLLGSDLGAGQQESLQLIKSSAKSCLALLSDLLDHSTAQLGKLSVNPAEFALRPFLDDVVKLFAPQAAARKLEVSCTVADEIPDLIIADQLRLRQVLQNLAGNAIKFTKAGSVTVSASLIPRAGSDSRIRFSVRDTGVGIPKEKQALIFEPFVQAHGLGSREYGGTGLGLSIASRIVQMMGGRIRVESEPGLGSVFSFTIPFRTPEIEPLTRGFDLKAALAVTGGDMDLLQELVNLFLQDYPGQIAQLRDAVAQGDFKRLEMSAHALKGAVANFGARAAVEAALRLEIKGRNHDLAEVESLLASFEEILDAFLAELRSQS